MYSIRPHRDRVLLELIPDDRISDGGILFADNVKKKYIRKGKVLAIANGCKEPLIPGQTVFAIWNCGVPIADIGYGMPYDAKEECRMFKSEDVVAVGTFAEAQQKFHARPPQPDRRHT
jgi:hypothetical protein